MPKRTSIDIVQLKQLINEGKSNYCISKILKISRDTLKKILIKNNIQPNKVVHTHSKETKLLLSIKRKLYLKQNPDKHPWRSHNKFKSVPCEKLKEWLILKHIQFVPEYTEHGIKDRNFSIDIALPDKKIALEVNGNQHYDRNGKLKSYYQERNNLLELVGWKVYQLHYSMCYQINKLENLLIELTTSLIKIPFDYSSYVTKKKEYKCIDCGVKICPSSNRCNQCYFLSQKSKIKPSKETMHYLVWNYPFTHLSKKFKISDNGIRKWCKNYTLKFPDNKYWGLMRHNKIIDYQI